MTHQLEARDADLGYRDVVVVEGLDLELPKREITSIVGSNGSGKSTILRALSRILKPKAGAVLLDGKALHRHRSREVAKILAHLPQRPHAPEGLTVWELVSFGRFPHRGLLGGLSDHDHQVIASVLDVVDLTDMADRPLESLSGGQSQRAWIAMALAQETEYLLLDEPITFLDWSYQIEVLHLLQRINREENKTIVMVLHDLNMAARYSTHMIAIRDGKVVVADGPGRVMTPEVLREVFGVEATIVKDPRTGDPICIPHLPADAFARSQDAPREGKRNE